jgi:hypothetical protein
MATPKYKEELTQRVSDLRAGLGKQPLAALAAIDQRLKKDERRLRRILGKKVWSGDIPFIERMEVAKQKLINARN